MKPSVPHVLEGSIVTTKTEQRLLAFFRIAIGAFFLAFLIQAFGPLRLDTDATNYLTMAVSSVEGSGFLLDGEAPVLPVGYPAIISILIRIGLAFPWAIVWLNVLFLGLGMVACYWLYTRVFNHNTMVSTALCLLTLCSYLFIKHVPLPRSEIVFFGMSTACLAAMHWSSERTGKSYWMGMGVALVLCAASVSIRTIGVALIPAFLLVSVPYSIRSGWSIQSLRSTRAGILVAIELALIVILLLALALTQAGYFEKVVSIVAKQGLLNRLMRTGSLNFISWGSLIANVPVSKLVSGAMKIGVGKIVINDALMALGLTGMGIWIVSLLRSYKTSPVLTVYAIGFAAVLFVWPGAVVRLWLPLWPILLGWLASVAIRIWRHRFGPILVGTYVTWIVLTGSVGLILNTSIAMSGSEFPGRYGDGTLTPTYVAAFGGLTGSENVVDTHMEVLGPTDVYKRALNLLIRFEPRVDERLKQDGPLR